MNSNQAQFNPYHKTFENQAPNNNNNNLPGNANQAPINNNLPVNANQAPINNNLPVNLIPAPINTDNLPAGLIHAPIDIHKPNMTIQDRSDYIPTLFNYARIPGVRNRLAYPPYNANDLLSRGILAETMDNYYFLNHVNGLNSFVNSQLLSPTGMRFLTEHLRMHNPNIYNNLLNNPSLQIRP